jgi:hypothetical protein
MTNKGKGLEDSIQLYSEAYVTTLKQLQTIGGLLQKTYEECDHCQEEFTRAQRDTHQVGKQKVASCLSEIKRQLT